MSWFGLEPRPGADLAQQLYEIEAKHRVHFVLDKLNYWVRKVIGRQVMSVWTEVIELFSFELNRSCKIFTSVKNRWLITTPVLGSGLEWLLTCMGLKCDGTCYLRRTKYLFFLGITKVLLHQR